MMIFFNLKNIISINTNNIVILKGCNNYEME
jgi:hypothetical protein